jgi:hypothetical protein
MTVTRWPPGRNTVDELHLSCPSGIAGNLFATCLTVAGVPADLLLGIPDRLGLPCAFHVVHDGYVLDGEYSCDASHPDPSGSLDDMRDVARLGYPGRVGDVIAEVLTIRYADDADPARQGESWCDTLFDASAAVVGLSFLGWPDVVVHGALPWTHRHHPVSAVILADWQWAPLDVNVELVTPTGAAVLSRFARQVTAPYAGRATAVSGRFTRDLGLDPVRIGVRSAG